MKKIIFAIAAVVALAACSKTEYDEVQNEISFAPVTENMTKSMMTGTTFQTTEEFNLWSYYKPVDAGSVDAWLASTATPQEYINEKTFAYKNSVTKWGGKANPYFWPKTGSLVFTGYYPTAIADSVTYSLPANTMTFTDIPQSRVAASGYTEDIMYFNLTPSYASGAVAAEFKHALSWISVILVKSNDTPDEATITANRVEFTGVLPTGDATVVGANDIVWVADGTAASVDVLEGNPAVLAKSNTAVVAYQPLFIPQTMAGDLVIEYEIKSNDGSKFTEVETITLNQLKDSDDNALSKWDPAKHYTYTITIGTSEILVQPTVLDWANVTIPTEIE
jgi:hypothetical protein